VQSFDPRALAGTVVDRYLLEALIGEGGFGVVFRARHTVTSALVAVKVIRPGEADAGPRFLREAKASATIGSRHVVPATDAGVTRDGLFFLVMELLDGESLSQVLRRMGRLSQRRAVAITLQVLDAIGAAHARGIVHRDLKPANVFITRDELGGELVRVLDFGVMKVRDRSFATREGVMLGTPAYFAPELFAGVEADPRTDLYAVSLMLYEMLAGVRPFAHPDVLSLARRIVDEPPPPIASKVEVDRDLAALIERGLAKDPAARWQTAADLSEALSRLARTSTSVRPPPPALEPPPVTRAPVGVRAGWIAAGAMALFVALLACAGTALVVGWLSAGGTDAPPTSANRVDDELRIDGCGAPEDVPATFSSTGDLLTVSWVRGERQHMALNLSPSLPREAVRAYDLENIDRPPPYAVFMIGNSSYGTLPSATGGRASGNVTFHEWALEAGRFDVEFEEVVLYDAIGRDRACRVNGSLRSD
jgi:hypothetical protein